MSWHRVELSEKSICHETEKAILIQIPKTNLRFWHPMKVCFFDGNDKFTISFKDDFDFTIFENGAGGERINDQELKGKELLKKYLKKYLKKGEKK